MLYLIYDKRGMVLDTIFVDPTVSHYTMSEAMSSFKREYNITDAMDFNIETFQLYLYSVYKIKSTIDYKRDRLNLGV